MGETVSRLPRRFIEVTWNAAPEQQNAPVIRTDQPLVGSGKVISSRDTFAINNQDIPIVVVLRHADPE